MNSFQKFLSKVLPPFLSHGKLFTFGPPWTRFAFTFFTAERLIREGYKANAAVSACATTLQLTFPEPPLITGTKENGRFTPDYSHPMLALLEDPNEDMGQAEFLQYIITYASIGGNAYIWKQRAQNGQILALWPFSDVQIRPIRGIDTDEGFIAYYEYFSGFGVPTAISKDDIIHWKWMIDPQYPWRGIGAIELSAREVDKDSEATAYIYSLLKNNAVPPVVITMEEGDEPSQDEIDAMGAKWVQKHHNGQPAFITHGMKAEALGYDMHRLAGETLSDVPETRIAANFHVPPSVAGLNVGIKRSDYGDAAARKAYTEQTLMALWRSLASELLNGLKPDYPKTPKNFTLKFDTGNVGALQEQKKDQWTRATDAFSRGAMTRAEWKLELGLTPLPDDDVYLISLATEMVPVGQMMMTSPKPALGAGGKNQPPSAGAKNSAQAPLSPKLGKTPNLGEDRKAMKAGGRALQKIRMDVAKRMTAAVDVYFSQLSDRVVARAGKSAPLSSSTTSHPQNMAGKQMPEKRRNLGGGKKDGLPNAGDLLNADDMRKLEALIKRFYVEVLQLSWDQWNYVLGIEKAFDLTDPIVTKVLMSAAQSVKDINDTTMNEIRDVLKYGNENGWSIDQLVRGDANQPGLRAIVDESYKGRAETIARTELGKAQNEATVDRYKNAGVDKVEIMDGGGTDSDAECDEANGQIWTLELFQANDLQHPNCTRAAAPYFGDEEPMTDWPYPFG